MTDARSGFDPDLYPTGGATGASVSAVSWSAIVAGAVTAIALTLVLVTLGSAFGLAAISPWPGAGARATTFTIGAGLWLIVTQWLSSAVGGYLAGRMRTRWTGLHTDEVFFRDTAHGLITWAFATVVIAVVALAAVTLSSLATPAADLQTSAATADAARKAAIAFATFTGLSMVVGAFIAAVCGAIGGRLRDLHP